MESTPQLCSQSKPVKIIRATYRSRIRRFWCRSHFEPQFPLPPDHAPNVDYQNNHHLSSNLEPLDLSDSSYTQEDISPLPKKSTTQYQPSIVSIYTNCLTRYWTYLSTVSSRASRIPSRQCSHRHYYLHNENPPSCRHGLCDPAPTSIERNLKATRHSRRNGEALYIRCKADATSLIFGKGQSLTGRV